MEHSAEKDAGYPTRWAPVDLACGNHKCRVTTYVGLVVYPLRACPLCGGDGEVFPPEKKEET